MFCGYQTVYDYCNENYSYTYANLIEYKGYAVPDSGNFASVYRTDILNNNILLLESTNYNPLNNCDINDDNDGITIWGCYQIYLINGGQVSDPPLEQYKISQSQIIQNSYKAQLNAGILISIDNFITNVAPYQDGAYVQIAPEDTTNYKIHLPASEEDIINFSNILSQATLINTIDSKNKLTPVLDYYNVAHFLNYLNLANILSNYFNQIKTYTNIKDNLLYMLDNAQSISDIQNLSFYAYKPSSKVNAITDITQKNSPIIQSNSIDC